VLVAILVGMTGCGDDSDGSSPLIGAEDDGGTDDGGTGDGGTGDGSVRYLALGDSLSQGVGAPDEATGSFPALLAEEWRADGCTVELQNAGISGYTAGQIITDELPQVETFEPTVITFQGGGNDIANGVTIDQYRADVGTVLDAAVDSGARVLVLYQNEWSASPVGVDYGDIEPLRDDFDEALEEEATSRGAEVVDLRDLYAQQAEDGQWVEDGLHPTPEAYASWATAIADAVPTPC
jgi:lysophospholipase L1-like esterase